MLSLQFGPFALPLNPLLMLAGWWLAAWLADRMSGPLGEPTRRMAGRGLVMGAVVGLIASRGAFVALAWEAYASEPLTMLNLRDGGWMPWAGLAAGLGVLGGFAWRYPATRRALAVGATAGVAAWSLASTVLGVHERPALPALVLPSVDGSTQTLASDGRPMVVNLWATWCAPCRTEMPILAHAQLQHPQLRFVFVNHGEAAATAASWLASQPYELQNVLLDTRQQLAPAVGTSGLPTTLFVDGQGRIVERHFGPLSAPSLAAALSRLR
mgnify:CR=1 FL=1